MNFIDGDFIRDVLHKFAVDITVEVSKKIGKKIVQVASDSNQASRKFTEESLRTPVMSKVLELEGTMGYSVKDSTIEMRAEKIVNNRNGGTSGTLRLSLWATKSLYSGGTLRGNVLGSSKLDPLEGGYYYNNITKTTSYNEPSGGYYYLTIILEEYDSSSDDNWPMMDYITFDDKIFWGNPLVIEGSIEFSINDFIIKISAENIENKKHTKTNALRLTCWATEKRYNGGSIHGYILGKKKLNPLQGGYSYKNLNVSMDYSEPKSGEYYLTFILEEYDTTASLTFILEEYDTTTSDNWRIKDYATFKKPHFLGKEILLEGLEYSISDSTVELTIRKLTHNRPRQKSGRLQISLLATENPYAGGQVKGYVLTKKYIDALQAKECYEGQQFSLEYNEPPEGEYYVTGFIEEYSSKHDDWITKDFILFKNKLYTDGIGHLPYNGLFAMLGKFAKADGVVTKEEIDIVDTILKDSLKLDAEDRKAAIQSFNNAKNSHISFEKFIRKLYRKFKDDDTFLELVVEILFMIAKTSERLNEQHEKFILTTIQIFNIEQENYNRHSAQALHKKLIY